MTKRERRTIDFIDTQLGYPDDRPDDINDGINRANLMKMYFFDIYSVYFCFCFSQVIKDVFGCVSLPRDLRCCA